MAEYGVKIASRGTGDVLAVPGASTTKFSHAKVLQCFCNQPTIISKTYNIR